MRSYQALRQNFGLDFFAANALARVERANSFHQCFFKSAPYSHDFADGFHLWPKTLVGAVEFLELPLGNFYDHVIEGWLEARRSLAGDVVRNLVERVADCELGGNLCDRKS